jgi:hypothetical protein
VKKIGYHYTSLDCWHSIQRIGLTPYLCDHLDIVKVTGKPVFGIYVWTTRLVGLEHAGSILFQMSRRGSPNIVELSFSYDDPRDLWSRGGRILRLRHTGSIDARINDVIKRSVNYHTDIPSVLVIRTIKPDDITLCSTYDIVKLLERKRKR